MAATLAHRGPDAEGFHRDGPVGLAHRRLSIIDLAGGAQPMFDPYSGAAITFNGEIYNFVELRRRLEAAGIRLHSNSDTEVILHLYRLHGPRCVEHLRGMFAFAIWDPHQQRLFLARDRVGKKPLYYSDLNGVFLFASEAKALLAHPDVPREVDVSSLHSYLTLQYVPAPATMYQHIRKLPPAHIAEVTREGVRVESYWKLHYTPKVHVSEADMLDEVDRRLAEATRIRLISDVPLGAFLSGGIDSSLVVAYMAKASPSRVKTFSVGFAEEEFNELPYARMVAKQYDTDHHEFICRADAATVLPQMISHFDEPMGDPSSLPTYYLSQMTRQHVTVALNGDGGDETFAGYQRYNGNVWVRRYSRLVPLALRTHLIRPSVRAARRLLSGNALVRRLHLLNEYSLNSANLYIGFMRIFSPEMKSALYGPVMQPSLATEAEDHLRFFYQADDLPSEVDRMLYCDTMTYLPGDLLVKVDRMSMAHSLEARSPFLDHQVMEYAASLPGDLKLRGATLKYLLKKVAARHISPELIHRRKQGFGIPADRWFRQELAGVVTSIFRQSELARAGYLDQKGTNAFVADHVAGRTNNGYPLWVLLNLELWYRLFILKHPLSLLDEARA